MDERFMIPHSVKMTPTMSGVTSDRRPEMSIARVAPAMQPRPWQAVASSLAVVGRVPNHSSRRDLFSGS